MLQSISLSYSQWIYRPPSFWIYAFYPSFSLERTRFGSVLFVAPKNEKRLATVLDVCASIRAHTLQFREPSIHSLAAVSIRSFTKSCKTITSHRQKECVCVCLLCILLHLFFLFFVISLNWLFRCSRLFCFGYCCWRRRRRRPPVCWNCKVCFKAFSWK